MTSVLIEGTICITVHGGRTTVVQLAERYNGLVPEVGCDGDASEVAAMSAEALDAGQADGDQKPVDGYLFAASPSKNGFIVEGLSQNESVRSHVVPSKRNRPQVATAEADKDSNNNQTGVADAEQGANDVKPKKTASRSGVSARMDVEDFGEDLTEIDVDDDDEDIRSSSSLADDEERSRNVSNAVRQTASDRRELNDEDSTDADDSAVQDMSLSFADDTTRFGSASKADGSSTAQDLRSPMSISRRRFGGHGSSSKSTLPMSSPVNAMNGHHDGSDLLLSSPQDLTAQVRNVIRQRLMASKQLSPYEVLHQGVVAAAAVGGASAASFVRPQSSPYYRAVTSPHQWSTPGGAKRDMTEASSSAAVNAAARRLMTSPYTTSPATAASPMNHHQPLHASHNHHHLLSPTAATPIAVGLPGSPSPAAAAAAIQFGASLHNLLGMRAAAAAAAVAAAAAAAGSTGTVGQTLDLKMRGGSVTSPTAGNGNDLSSSGISGTAAICGSDQLAANGSSVSTNPSSAMPPAVGGSEQQKIYRCDYCFKTFLFKSKYHEHLPVHTSARPFQCHLCTRTYKYKYDLRVHLRTHLGIPTKSTVCPFCADRFATNKLLRQHMRNAHSDDQATATSVVVPPVGSATAGAATTGTVEVPVSTPPTVAGVTSSVSDGSSVEDSTSRMSDAVEQTRTEVSTAEECADEPEVKHQADDVCDAGEKLTVDVVS